MGKATGLIKELSGKVGPLMFQQTKSGKVAVYVAPEVPETPMRTKKQMELRLAWGNLGAVYSQFHKTLKRSHEGLEAGRSDYNAFIKDNTRMTCVYLKKYELANGGCVLAPYKISNGKLPSIYCDTNEGNVLVTDIELGELVIDEETTVSEFSTAVLMLNEDWEEGDQLTFFYGQQSTDPVTQVPRAKIRGMKVKLDVSDETPLWDVVKALGFSSVDGYLGMDRVITDGAAAWVHSREDEQGNLKVSAQWLTVDSSVLQSYMGDAAFEASVQSYGGITNRKVFLRPDAETNTVSGGWFSNGGRQSGGNAGGGSSQSGGGSTGGNTGGGTTGGETGGNTGGNTGGGGQTTTVAAPTFSGETQFTESTQVTMTAESGAEIRYTTDGSTPTATSGTVYSGPVTLTETTTVKAVAVKDGVTSSVTSRTYTKGSNAGGGGDDGGDDEGNGDID